ncbi:hypothetical protein [Bradyrhizobium sp. 186]|uniref:hypothetical protein n=1 Tax=Bradyrhizobium sp. 186 TaxID=2782654 RepID=UPI0020007FEF|nr:hypothetical protein [Bradyrhizobium sp. 186]
MLHGHADAAASPGADLLASFAPQRKLALIKATRVRRDGRMTMKYLGLALVVLLTVTTSGAGRASEPIRFAPLKPDDLSPPQKEWADAIATPPRNAKITNPPYRAYIRNPELAPKLSAMSDYLRWNSRRSRRGSANSPSSSPRGCGRHTMNGLRIIRSP